MVPVRKRRRAGVRPHGLATKERTQNQGKKQFTNKTALQAGS
jgi:hypothetical protein